MTISKKGSVSVQAVLVASHLLFAAVAWAQSVSFLDHVDYEAGSPRSVAVGDFNRDGVPDLAAASFNGVSVLLGNGDGTFQPQRNFGAGISPSSVAVGDFNGDGIQDLAVANEGSFPYYEDGSIAILFGTGDGDFAAACITPAGDTPAAIASADFNGDGKSDVVIVNSGHWVDAKIGYAFVPDEIAQVFLGNGDGTFQSPVVLFLARDTPVSVAVGDFNGDGAPDVAVLNNRGPLFAYPGSVSVFLGNGDGSFQLARHFDVGFGSYSVTVGDFNGDGVPDLAVANAWVSNFISVHLGNGDGTFQPARTFAAGRNPISVAVEDFNRDGALDLAVTNSLPDTVSGYVLVLLGNGDGSFQTAQSFGVGRGPFSVAAADFNGDGMPDLAVANQRSGTVSVLINNSSR